MITQEQINEATRVAEKAELESSVAHSQVIRLKREFAFENFNIRAGSIVKYNGDVFRVSRVDIAWHPRRPWAQGLKKKKDGSYSERAQHIYDKWEVVEP